MATINATPLTGGTSIYFTNLLPHYNSYRDDEKLYIYYKVSNSTTSNMSIITIGAYIEAGLIFYCNSLDYVPMETDRFEFGPLTVLSVDLNDSFGLYDVCRYPDDITNIVGSLFDYEILGENTNPEYPSYAYRGIAYYRYWLGPIGGKAWPSFAVNSSSSVKLDAAWMCHDRYEVNHGLATKTFYLSINNLPYINSYPTEITDEISSFDIEYIIPNPSALDYVSYGILDTAGELLAGYKIAPGDATKYTFLLSDQDKETLYARFNTVNTTSIQLGVRVKNLNEDPILVTYPMRLDIIIEPPTLEIDAIDTDTAAKEATGDNTVFVRYQSDVNMVVTPKPTKGATITSYYVGFNNQRFYDQRILNFTDITSPTFELYVKDSRGNSSLTHIGLNMVQYFPLTCNLSAEPPTTDDKIHVSLSGKYWDGNFGAKNNIITFEYKYTSNVEGNAIDWTPLSATPSIGFSQESYSTTFAIDIPNHVDTYTVQVRVSDVFRVVESNSATVKSLPIFDWGQGDFNFNVPVTINSDLIVTGSIHAEALAADSVVETGTSGIWTYRLWESGIAECWGTVAPASISITTAWGSIYTKDNAIPRQNYPFTFIDVPVVSMNLYNTTGNCWPFTGTQGTASQTPAFGLARGTSGSVTTGAQITAIGRWK